MRVSLSLTLQTVVGTPLPAMAQPTLTQKQAQEAQELLAIIEKRTGKGLPRLQASPSVATQVRWEHALQWPGIARKSALDRQPGLVNVGQP